MRHVFGCLVVASLAAAMIGSNTGPVRANGVVDGFDHHPDVRVFTPTPLPPRAQAHEPAPVRPVKVVVNVTFDGLALDRGYRRALAWAYRRDHVHWAIGHRYPGFVGMYSGPRYPF